MFKFFKIKAKPEPKRTIMCIVYGYVPWGIGCRMVYYNLYEDDQGNRSFEEFQGAEYMEQPDNCDFSVRARVIAWLHGGAFPRSVLENV